jgi:hypothetical protein
LNDKPHEPLRDGSLLTPALSSTSVWRRGRWGLGRGFTDSMRELVLEILSLPTSRGEREET